MNSFKEISPEMIRKNPFQMIGKDWMMITAGDENKVNTMTASWGGLGVMYGKNAVFIVVRPQRYTKEFLDREDTFSLSFLGKEYRKEMNYLGTVSGRYEDKIAKCGLTVERYEGTPYFSEANHVLFCRKLYVQQFEGECILEERFKSTFYSNMDYHYMYIAEVINAFQATRNKDKALQ